MYVAIFSTLLRSESVEDSLGSFARIQELSANPLAGHYFNELDVVLLRHRMRHTAYLHLVAFDDRHMFLRGRIRCLLLEEFHGLTATDEVSTTNMKEFHDIAAKFALKDVQLLHSASFLL